MYILQDTFLGKCGYKGSHPSCYRGLQLVEQGTETRKSLIIIACDHSCMHDYRGLFKTTIVYTGLQIQVEEL